MNLKIIPILGERFLFFCPAKSGKSHLAKSFAHHIDGLPDVKAAVFDLDGKQNYRAYADIIDKDLGDVYYCTSAKEYEKAIEAASKKDYGLWILDHVDRLIWWSNDSFCEAHEIDYVGDFGSKGAGYGRVAVRMIRFLNQFWSLAEKNVDTLRASVVVCHQRVSDDGKTKSLFASDSISKPLCAEVSHIGNIEKELVGGKVHFMLNFHGGSGDASGSRDKVLQNAGNIDITNHGFDTIVDLFRPSDKVLSKAWSWVESEGGWSKEQFEAILLSKNIKLDDGLRFMHLIRKLKSSPDLLAKYHTKYDAPTTRKAV